jgi:hypothetical protein
MLKKINAHIIRHASLLNRIFFQRYIDNLMDRYSKQQDEIYAKVFLFTLQKMGKQKTVLNYIQSQKQKVTSQSILSAMEWLDMGGFPPGMLDGFFLLEKKVDRKILYANILFTPLPVALCMCFSILIKGCPWGLHLVVCIFAGYLIGTSSVLVSLRIETYLKRQIYTRWLKEQEATINVLRVVDL